MKGIVVLALALWMVAGSQLEIVYPRATGGPLLEARMTDSLVDSSGDMEVNPGDTVTYRIVIHNFGDEATDLSFEDMVDANTTLIAGSVQTTPIARDDAYATDPGAQLNVDAVSGVLANDTDADGVGPAMAVSSADDQSAQSLTPNVTVNADGSFSYDPPAGLVGSDTFSYTVDDGEGNQRSAMVSLVVEQVPLAAADSVASASAPGQRYHTALNTALNVPIGPDGLLANDTLGSPSTTLVSFGGGDLGGAADLHSAGSNVALGSGSLQVNPDGSFSWTPDTDFTGRFTFEYRIANGAGSSDGLVILAAGVRAAGAADGLGATGNIFVDSSLIPFSVLDNDAGDLPSIVNMDTSSAQGGTVAHLGGGQFTYLPPTGYDGTDTFDYTLSNGFGAEVATVTMTVADAVWFLDGTAPAGGDGRSTAPFNTIAQFDAVNGLGGSNNPEAGDGVVLREGAYAGPLTLLDGQMAVGDGSSADLATAMGIPLAPGSVVAPFSGTPPSITSTSHGVQLAAGNTVRGISIGDTPTGTGITGTSLGTFSIVETSITGAGAALFLSGGNVGTVSIPSITSNASSGSGIELEQLTGGTFNVGNLVVDNPAGRCIDIDNSSASFVFTTVDLDGAGDSGISIQNTTGNVTVTGGTVGASATGQGVALLVSGGNGTVDVGASLTNGVDRSISILSRTGGAINLSGNITDTGAGIQISGNNGGTTTFTGSTITLNTNDVAVDLGFNSGHDVTFNAGSLSVQTIGNVAMRANNGGNLVVQGSSNTLSATNAEALEMVDVNIGPAGLTFRSISASGGSSGIVLTNTGGAGGLTVTGDGSLLNNASGGTIQGTTSHAILLDSAQNLTLQAVNIDSPAGNGISITTSSNLTLSAITINAPVGNGIDAVDLAGTCRLDSGSVVTGLAVSGTSYLSVFNTNTNLTGLTLDASSFTNQGSANTEPVVALTAAGSSNMTLTAVNGCQFTGLNGWAISSTAGNNPGDAASLTTNVAGCSFLNASLPAGNGGINLLSKGAATHNFLLSNNTLTDVGRDNTAIGAINVESLDTAVLDGTIVSNDLDGIGYRGVQIATFATVPNLSTFFVDGNFMDDVSLEAVFVSTENFSRVDMTLSNNQLGTVQAVGALGREGVEVRAREDSQLTMLIQDNSILNLTDSTTDETVDIDAENNAVLSATVTGNTITATGTEPTITFEAEVEGGNGSFCLDLDNNTANGGGTYVLDEHGFGQAFSVENIATVDSRNVGTVTINDVAIADSGGDCPNVP